MDEQLNLAPIEDALNDPRLGNRGTIRALVAEVKRLRGRLDDVEADRYELAERLRGADEGGC